MNEHKIGTQTCYIYQCTKKDMLMYIACLCLNLVSAHFYAITTNFLFTCSIYAELNKIHGSKLVTSPK